jgi:hypothetical protein
MAAPGACLGACQARRAQRSSDALSQPRERRVPVPRHAYPGRHDENLSEIPDKCRRAADAALVAARAGR